MCRHGFAPAPSSMNARDDWRHALETSAVHIAMVLGVTPKQVRADFTKAEIGEFFRTEAFELYKARQEALFPAPAGMNRRQRACSQVRQAVPRASGDEPHVAGFLQRAFALFPAPAGMNRTSTSSGRVTLVCSPRQRG